jgi:thiol-disulfide isomerase/thioredoxin
MAEDVSPAPQAFSLVEVRPEQGDLVALLEAHAARAAELERRPFVEFSATWCPPCIALQRSLQDERMIEAFRGTYVIRLDIDEWEDHLAPAGFLVFGVPTFVEVDGDGRPTDRSLTGAAWGPDVPENMAPVLGEFFRGS